MDKKTIILIVSCILLIITGFIFGLNRNKPVITEGGVRGQTETNIKDANGAGF